MGISRRSVLVASLAATGAGLGAAGLYTASTSEAASAPGDVVGKVTVGYQGWFAASGDGSPVNRWWHWDNNTSNPPSPSDNFIKAWPDVRELTTTYATGFAALGNGQPARLFSSWTDQTIDTHVKWTQQYGIDTLALQRFADETPTRNGVTTKLRAAAEKYGRKFYIMYDISGWTTFATAVPSDWTSVMAGHTASSAYARQNGKPVVCIWGLGFPDRPGTAAECLNVINFFKAQGCYVIGGVPREWRTNGAAGTKPNFGAVYDALNMISPWMVGAIGTVADVDNYYNNLLVPDQAYCNSHGIDFQPCVLPGDLVARQRKHGDFMWRQFYNVVRGGVQGIYISMFDEYGEGNQIAKTAENSSQIPAGSGFLALDEDGTACSADYYLRLTGDGGRMLKGQLALTATRPTAPLAGGPTTTPPTTTPPVTGTFSLRSRANNLYVTAGTAGTGQLIASATTIGPSEQFTTVNVTGGVALRSVRSSQYVCAENAGASPLIANRASASTWETFTLIRNTDGTVSLRAAANSMIVCADNAGASPLIANRTAASTWESFDQIAA
jgi:hypothetical protein